MNTVVIFVKFPSVGHVKTRLGEEIGFENAAELYRLFIKETFNFVGSCATEQVLVAVTPKEKLELFKKEYLWPDFRHFAQEGDDLGHRLSHAFEVAQKHAAGKTLIIGSDSPTLPARYLDDAFQQLDKVDLVLGPAADGGYYLIGLKNMHEALFRNMEWSTDSVLSNTLQRARKIGLTYELLPEWYDIDTLPDLRRAADDDENGRIRSFLSQNIQILS